jgi:hypothetical protein
LVNCVPVLAPLALVLPLVAVRGEVALEALAPGVHVRAEVARVAGRVAVASVTLELVVVAVGAAAADLKSEEI